MPIEAITTHTVPQVNTPERTFPNLWILDLVIRAHGGTLADATVYLNVAPCNSVNDDIDMLAQQEIRIQLLEYLVIPVEGGGPNPLAIAMGAVEAAVPWVAREQARIALEKAQADGLLTPANQP